jgi:hypothetical protein
MYVTGDPPALVVLYGHEPTKQRRDFLFSRSPFRNLCNQ